MWPWVGVGMVDHRLTQLQEGGRVVVMEHRYPTDVLVEQVAVGARYQCFLQFNQTTMLPLS